jgi:outer membrane immunogenic protein
MKKPAKLLFGLGVAGAGLAAAAMPGQAADIYRPPVSVKDTAPVEYAPAITWTGFYLGGNIGAIWPNDELEILDDDAQLIGGAHLGFNWQAASGWVFGAEGDINLAEDIEYLASVRGRLGYAFGRTLLYGTGGVAFAGFGDNALDEDATGWVAGGGVETKVRENMSLGLEALYYDFDEAESSLGDDASIDALTVRGRMTIHLNGGREPLR